MSPSNTCEWSKSSVWHTRTYEIFQNLCLLSHLSWEPAIQISHDIQENAVLPLVLTAAHVSYASNAMVLRWVSELLLLRFTWEILRKLTMYDPLSVAFNLCLKSNSEHSFSHKPARAQMTFCGYSDLTSTIALLWGPLDSRWAEVISLSLVRWPQVFISIMHFAPIL